MKKIILLLIISLGYLVGDAQIKYYSSDYLYKNKVSIGTQTLTATPSSVWLRIGDSASNRAMVLPTVKHRDSVALYGPLLRGMTVWDLSDGKVYWYDGSAWVTYGASGGENIYNTSDTITANRTVELSTRTLLFNTSNSGNYQVLTNDGAGNGASIISSASELVLTYTKAGTPITQAIMSVSDAAATMRTYETSGLSRESKIIVNHDQIELYPDQGAVWASALARGPTSLSSIKIMTYDTATQKIQRIDISQLVAAEDSVALLRNPTISGYAILDFSSYIDTVYGKRFLAGFGISFDSAQKTITPRADTFNITSRLDRYKLRDSLLAIVNGNNGLTETANVIQLGGALIQGTTITPGAFQMNFEGNALGITQTETSGIRLQNTTAAAVGAQQISPAVYMRGSGWKTTATAASQSVEVLNYLLPVQGTTAPGYNVIWSTSINDAAYSNAMILSNTGLTVLGATGAAGGISISSAAPQASTFFSATGLIIANSSTGSAQTNQINNATGYQQTSGTTSLLYLSNGGITTGFFPANGTATHAVLDVAGYIDQNVAATGISSGVHITTIIEAAEDWRAIWIDAGTIYLNNTMTAAATTGNQTIHKASGSVNIAAGQSTITVTNSWVNSSSIVFAVVRTNDATATLKNVVCNNGSFVITLTAAATAETSIGFVVFNSGPDLS